MSMENYGNMNSYGIILLGSTDFTNETFCNLSSFNEDEKKVLTALLKDTLEQAFHTINNLNESHMRCEKLSIYHFIQRSVKVLTVRNRYSFTFYNFMKRCCEYYKQMQSIDFEQMTSQELEFIHNPSKCPEFLNGGSTGLMYWNEYPIDLFKVERDIQVIQRSDKVHNIRTRFTSAFYNFMRGRCEYYNNTPYIDFKQMTSQELEFVHDPSKCPGFINGTFWKYYPINSFKTEHDIPSVSPTDDLNKLSVGFPRWKQNMKDRCLYDTLCRELLEVTGITNDDFHFIIRGNDDAAMHAVIANAVAKDAEAAKDAKAAKVAHAAQNVAVCAANHAAFAFANYRDADADAKADEAIMAALHADHTAYYAAKAAKAAHAAANRMLFWITHPLYHELNFAVAVSNVDVELGATSVMNKGIHSFSWVTLENIGETREIDREYRQIICDIKQLLANTFIHISEVQGHEDILKKLESLGV